MALNEVDPAVNRYTANGSTDDFAYTFEIASDEHIEVLDNTTVQWAQAVATVADTTVYTYSTLEVQREQPS